MTQKPTPDALDHFIGEIPPTHDELVKIKQNNKRNKWQNESANDAFNHFRGQEVIKAADIEYFIRNWKPRVNQ